MSQECKAIHQLFQSLERHQFPFDKSKIPLNGIYILFEKGESGHKGDRIVRIGTHTGINQLRSRLKQHFLNKNKDRSIFRKNIGRAILNHANDPFLASWEIDLTTRQAKELHLANIDLNYQQTIEENVSEYIQTNFSFCTFEVENKTERLRLESKIISTVSWCKDCIPSPTWLGNFSPKRKIAESGLWLVNELHKEPLDIPDIDQIKTHLEIHNDTRTNSGMVTGTYF